MRKLTDQLATDPFTAAFISRKLIHHLAGEPVSEEDVERVQDVWKATDGWLPDIHREVLRIAAESPGQRFHWPSIWMIQVLRLSDATLVKGFREIDTENLDEAERRPRSVLEELGNHFWSKRQPNGFSDRKADWVSTEHLDRRIRLANLVFLKGRPARSVDQIILDQGLGASTRDLVSRGRNEQERFVLLMCSPEIMEV